MNVKDSDYLYLSKLNNLYNLFIISELPDI